MKSIPARLFEFFIDGLWQLLPLDVASGFGAFLVRIIALRFHRTTAATRRTLQTINPAYSEQQLDEQLIRMWQSIGRVWAESLIVDRLVKHRLKINGVEYLISAKKSGRPIIVLFIHTGNWELITPVLVAYNLRPHAPVEVQPRKLFDDLLNKKRKAYGLVVIQPTLTGTRKIFQCLERGDTLCLAIDEYKDHQVLGPLFGRKLSCPNNLDFALRLAKIFKAVMLPMYASRLANANFELHISPPFQTDELMSNEGQARVKSDLETWSERAIRDHIDQWYMLHRLRFK